MSTKNVLFISPFFSPHIGGVESHVYQVAQELILRGWKVNVLTIQYDDRLELESSVEKIEIFRIPKEWSTTKIRIFLSILCRRKLFFQADVIHVHDVFWWVLPLYPSIRKKIFLTFHGWEGVFPPKLSAITQRQLAQKMVRGSIQIGSYIKSWYKTNANFTLYGAATIDVTPPKKKKVQNLVFLGRLSMDNSVDKVIETVQILQLDQKDLQMTFVGDGPLSSECRKVGNVTGFISDVKKALAEADLVFSSSYLSIFNAIAAGKLVCSFFDNDLKKEYLTQMPIAASLIIECDASKMAKRIQELTTDPKRMTSMIAIGQDWVREQSWSTITDVYLKLWRINTR